MQILAATLRILAVRKRLAEIFDIYIVTLQRQIEWPPRSADLTSLEFFL